MAWSPASWRAHEARQQPAYPDQAALGAAERELAAYPALTPIAAADALRLRLSEAQAGKAFLLQGGDCAESFAEFSPETIAANHRLLSQVAALIQEEAGLPVIAVGRMAGQFAKPRSAECEHRGGAALPAYRGDIVNGLAFDAVARRPDPDRMFRAYGQSAATLAHLARLAGGAPVFTGHEALLLPYEQALVRFDASGGRAWGSSAPFLWIGDRTRFTGSAHVELLRGLANPLGVKCGPSLEADELLRLLDLLDPEREPGRITLISRMGHDRVEARLPALMRAVRGAGSPVLWCCDPMHGNTSVAGGRKTRLLPRIRAELDAFFACARAEGVRPGGVHLEMTGRDILECVDSGARGGQARYDTHCDPRLNAPQAMLLGRFVAGLITGVRATGAQAA